jgi:protein subunit release factor B
MKEDTRERITILSKKDLDISYFCGSGAGGQARNKVASGVLITHKESGAQGRCSESRSQDQNKRKAFENLCKTPKLKFWISQKLFEIREQETMEEQISRDLDDPSKMKYEVKIDGKWKEVGPEYFLTQGAKNDN